MHSLYHANGSGRFCFTHGGRRVPSHASCLNFAQAGGRCIKHGYKKPTCSVDGCGNQSLRVDFSKNTEPTVISMSSLYKERIQVQYVPISLFFD
jgi:hypothetical protein